MQTVQWFIFEKETLRGVKSFNQFYLNTLKLPYSKSKVSFFKFAPSVIINK